MRVLLSIKPEFAEKILCGEKLFEYRKSLFKNKEVTQVVIYSTLPVGKVVGEFKIAYVHSATPREIWKRTEGNSGISWRFFFRYFKGRKIAHAIEIKDVTRFEKPLELIDVLGRNVAPQSFAYIN